MDIKIPIIGTAGNEGHYPINFYFHPELEQGRPGLMQTPGLTKYATINIDGGEIRGAWDIDGVLYVVCGSAVYRYLGGVATVCVGALLTDTGHVLMVDNGTQVMIIDGVDGYTVTGLVVTTIADADFPVPYSLTFQDGYGIVTEKDSGRIYISGINDFTSWDPLEYVTAEAEPDDALAIISDHRELLVLGSASGETFWNSGTEYIFERIAGGHLQKGISAPMSLCLGDNAAFWLSEHRQALRAAGIGQTPQIISTRQLDKKFEAYTRVDDAFGFCMDVTGFTWYVLCFPSQNVTWVFNIATGRWHQWAAFAFGADVRHRSNCYVYYDSKHLVGDYQDGCLYQVDPFCFTDGDDMFRSSVIFPAIAKEGKRIFHSKLQADFKAGVGLALDPGDDPQAALQWSDDQMRTWSNEHWASMGKLGEYARRSTWNRLGSSRNRNYKITVTDPVERVIYAPAFLEAGIGNS